MHVDFERLNVKIGPTTTTTTTQNATFLSRTWQTICGMVAGPEIAEAFWSGRKFGPLTGLMTVEDARRRSRDRKPRPTNFTI